MILTRGFVFDLRLLRSDMYASTLQLPFTAPSCARAAPFSLQRARPPINSLTKRTAATHLTATSTKPQTPVCKVSRKRSMSVETFTLPLNERPPRSCLRRPALSYISATGHLKGGLVKGMLTKLSSSKIRKALKPLPCKLSYQFALFAKGILAEKDVAAPCVPASAGSSSKCAVEEETTGRRPE